jgi:hypothetical protein
VADDVGVGAEARSPETVAQDGDVSSGLIFGGDEGSPQQRLGAQDIEETRADCARFDVESFTRAGKCRRARVVGGDGFESAVLRSEIDEIGIAERAVHIVEVHIGALEPDEALALRKRKRLENDGVDDAEDGGVGADAEGQRQHHDGGETGLFREHTQGVANVLPQTIHLAIAPPQREVAICSNVKMLADCLLAATAFSATATQ